MDFDKIRQYINKPNQVLINPDYKLLEETIEKYPFFQSCQLLLLLARQHEGLFFSEEVLTRSAVYIGERSHLYQFIISYKYTGPAKSSTLNDNKVHISEKSKLSSELIEKFLDSKTIVQKPKAEFFNASDKAAKSIIEEEEFVSETLAKIYLRLQKYEKAIRIYQKLSLINPEKSNYFALLIENVKNKIEQ